MIRIAEKKGFFRSFHWLATLGLLFCHGIAAAQTNCLADQIAARNALRFPERTLRLEELQTELAQPASQENDPDSRGTIVTIPVVIHVVYKEEQENISEQQVISQIDVLNQDYRRQNGNAGTVPPIFASLAADVELEFCLAAIDPAGNPTNGITRRQTTWTNIGDLIAPDGRPRINYSELGGEDAWAPEHFLNIWVASLGGGVLGFGTFPGTAPPAEDGVVIDPRYFGTTGLATTGTPHHLGRTATHEIGHYLNLRHIWGGNNNVCTDDDDVTDTPVQRSPYAGCPAFPQFSCGNSAMFMNYMDYTDDSCMSLFTKGQKTRMWAALNVARSGLMKNIIPCHITAAPTPHSVTRFRLSPNPAGNLLWLQSEAFDETSARISVCDLTGKLRLLAVIDWNKGNRPSLDISPLPPGFYLLTVTKRAACFSVPFVKAL